MMMYLNDSKSGDLVAISDLYLIYDLVLKELLLKLQGEINYLSHTIQNENINMLGI